MSAFGAVMRVSSVLLGVVVMGYGIVLVTGLGGDLVPVLLWLAGGVLVHDLVVAPVVLSAGWALRRGGTPRWVRAGVQAFVVVAGTVLLASAPTLLGRAHVPAEPGLLEQPYWIGALVVLGVAVASALVAARSARRSGGGS